MHRNESRPARQRDAEAGAGISKERAKSRGGPRPALHVPDVDNAGSHRPHDLDPTAPGHLLARDGGGFPATNTRATVHGFRRERARWMRKEEVYLRVVGEDKRRRSFGAPPTMLHGGVERRDLHRPPERKRGWA